MASLTMRSRQKAGKRLSWVYCPVDLNAYRRIIIAVYQIQADYFNGLMKKEAGLQEEQE
jgi:hypothetical protein